jgi:translation initiation factor 3 subunit D
VKKNVNKASRWGIQAYLAGTDFMKIGFVSRTNPKIRNKHQILGTQVFSTDKYTSQCVNLSIANVWGIVMAIVEQVTQAGDGKYLLVKEPGVNTALRLYSVPEDAIFQDEDVDVEQTIVEQSRE